MADIFRKQVMDKVSNPDQLDRMVVIAPLKYWLAIIGGLLVIAAFAIWALMGSVADSVAYTGVCSPEGEITFYSKASDGVSEGARIYVSRKGDGTRYEGTVASVEESGRNYETVIGNAEATGQLDFEGESGAVLKVNCTADLPDDMRDGELVDVTVIREEVNLVRAAFGK